MAVGAVAAVVCGFGGLVTGVAIGSHGKHNTTASAVGQRSTGVATATASAEPDDTPTATGGPVLDGTQLLAKIIPAPAGAVDVPVRGSSNGVMTLDQYVNHGWTGSSVQLEKSLLTGRGFVVAAEHAWTASNGTEYAVELIEFDDNTGAESFVRDQNFAFGKAPSYPKTFDAPDVPLGHGYEGTTLDAVGNFRAALLAQAGSVAVIMHVYAPKSFDRTTELAMLDQQVKALQ